LSRKREDGPEENLASISFTQEILVSRKRKNLKTQHQENKKGEEKILGDTQKREGGDQKGGAQLCNLQKGLGRLQGATNGVQIHGVTERKNLIIGRKRGGG